MAAGKKNHGGRKRTKRDRFERAAWQCFSGLAMACTIAGYLGPLLLTRH